ncbi:hypothetical protein [Aliamphritea spongicola]|nr:hypothetical protein [Aliamphritea spongicola]
MVYLDPPAIPATAPSDQHKVTDLHSRHPDFYLILAGKLHWLGAAVAVALPFVRRLWPFLPFIGRFLQNRRNRQG